MAMPRVEEQQRTSELRLLHTQTLEAAAQLLDIRVSYMQSVKEDREPGGLRLFASLDLFEEWRVHEDRVFSFLFSLVDQQRQPQMPSPLHEWEETRLSECLSPFPRIGRQRSLRRTLLALDDDVFETESTADDVEELQHNLAALHELNQDVRTGRREKGDS